MQAINNTYQSIIANSLPTDASNTVFTGLDPNRVISTNALLQLTTSSTTDKLPEGLTNLYYTNTRFDTQLATKTTTDLTEGTNLYYTNTRFDTQLATKTTTDLAEGTNLYYTNTRFDTQLATKTTTDLAEGTNLYYTNTRFDTQLATKTTTDLAEGTNLYFTTTRARDSFTAGAGISIIDGLITNTAGGTIDASAVVSGILDSDRVRYVDVPDLRNEVITPKWIEDQINKPARITAMSLDNGLSGYWTSDTVRPWTDSSGPDPYQIGTRYQSQYIRWANSNDATAWESWYQYLMMDPNGDATINRNLTVSNYLYAGERIYPGTTSSIIGTVASPWNVIYANYYRSSNGSTSFPAYSFSSNADCGMYLDSSNDVGITVNNSRKLLCKDDEVLIQSDMPSTSTQGIALSTNYGSTSEGSSRIFMREITASDTYGFSIAYCASSSLAPILGLATNTFGIVAHNNSATGNPALTIERATGDVTIPNDLSVDGTITKLTPQYVYFEYSFNNQWYYTAAPFIKTAPVGNATISNLPITFTGSYFTSTASETRYYKCTYEANWYDPSSHDLQIYLFVNGSDYTSQTHYQHTAQYTTTSLTAVFPLAAGQSFSLRLGIITANDQIDFTKQRMTLTPV